MQIKICQKYIELKIISDLFENSNNANFGILKKKQNVKTGLIKFTQR